MRIPVRTLGEVLLGDFCPRCFWLKQNLQPGDDHPFSSRVPGVVNSLDSHTKKVFHFWMETGNLPMDLLEILEKAGMRSPLRSGKGPRWKAAFEGVTVTGAPDILLFDAEDRLFILDFKTARWSENQERLWPLYEGQVNGYAWLARREGLDVAGVGVVYMEILREDGRLEALHREHQDMFVTFRPRMKPARLMEDGEVEDLIRRVVEILRRPSPPAGRPECRGCEAYEVWKKQLP